MSEETSREPATGPVETPATTTPVVVHDRDVDRDERPRRTRLNVVAAWVGIVAGTVFVVAVIFFSGFVLGASVVGSGGHHHGGHHGQGQLDREGGGPPHRWQDGPGGPGGPSGFRPGFEGGQPGGPGFQGGGPGGGQGPGQGPGPAQGPGSLPQTPPSR